MRKNLRTARRPNWRCRRCKKKTKDTKSDEKQVMEEIQKEKELAGKEERVEKKEPRKLFMRWR